MKPEDLREIGRQEKINKRKYQLLLSWKFIIYLALLMGAL